MPIDVPPLAAVADKWVRNAGAASQSYRDGVQRATSWATPTAAAQDAWQQGVQQAISRNAFSAGVNAAGDARWRNRAIAVGAVRFGPGVAAAKQEYSEGFAPFLQIIAAIDLPPRGPRGSAQNLLRVETVANELHQARLTRTR